MFKKASLFFALALAISVPSAAAPVVGPGNPKAVVAVVAAVIAVAATYVVVVNDTCPPTTTTTECANLRQAVLTLDVFLVALRNVQQNKALTVGSTSEIRTACGLLDAPLLELDLVTRNLTPDQYALAPERLLALGLAKVVAGQLTILKAQCASPGVR
jgi:hypothetical protein